MSEQKPNVHEDTGALLDERNETHGSFVVNSRISQKLKTAFREEPGWDNLDPVHKEAIDHICGKFGRIMAGQPSYDDHWDDIAGYAQLPKKFHHGVAYSCPSAWEQMIDIDSNSGSNMV